MSLFSMTKIVMSSLFSRPSTRLYPFEPRNIIEGSRGNIRIEIDKCIFCGICAKKCPTSALAVERKESRWSMDRLRCITCGACVDACPKKCLFMDGAHMATAVTKDVESHIGAPKDAPKPAAS